MTLSYWNQTFAHKGDFNIENDSALSYDMTISRNASPNVVNTWDISILLYINIAKWFAEIYL